MQSINKDRLTIIALSFGDNKSRVNSILARETEKLIKVHPEANVFAQTEISRHISSKFSYRNIGCSDGYQDSFKVIKEAYSQLDKEDIEGEVIIVSHRDHFPRCRALAQEHFQLNVKNNNGQSSHYCKESGQVWVRNKFLFTAREVVANILYSLLYNKIDRNASATLGAISGVGATFILKASTNIDINFISLACALSIILSIAGSSILWILKSRDLNKLAKVFKFCVVGGANTIIDASIIHTFLLSFPGILLAANIGKVTGFIIALLFSFGWNKTWVFNNNRSQPKKTNSQFPQFVAVSTCSMLVNTITFSAIYYFTTSAGITNAIGANIAVIAATAASLINNYIGYSFIFKGECKK